MVSIRVLVQWQRQTSVIIHSHEARSTMNERDRVLDWENQGRLPWRCQKMSWGRKGTLDLVNEVGRMVQGSGREHFIQWKQHLENSCGRGKNNTATKQQNSMSFVVENFVSNSFDYLQVSHPQVYMVIYNFADSNSNCEAVWVALTNFFGFTIIFIFSIEGAT